MLAGLFGVNPLEFFHVLILNTKRANESDKWYIDEQSYNGNVVQDKLNDLGE